jgi:hypothetical protein
MDEKCKEDEEWKNGINDSSTHSLSQQQAWHLKL